MFDTEDTDNQLKLYVVVRQDLTHGQQLAQTGHAAAEFARRYPVHVETAPTICVLGVPNEGILKKTWKIAQQRAHVGKRAMPFMFFEPDFGADGEWSAFAVVSMGPEFSHLRLAGGPHKVSFYRRLVRRLFGNKQ